MSSVVSWSTRGRLHGLAFSGGGFLVLGTLPGFAPPTPERLLTQLLFFAVALGLLCWTLPRTSSNRMEKREREVVWRAGRKAPVPLVHLQAAPSESLLSGRRQRFSIVGTRSTGERIRIHEAEDPAELWTVLERVDSLLPWSLDWGTGNLAPIRPFGAVRSVVGFPFPARLRVRRIVVLLTSALAMAWIVILSWSASPVSSWSIALAAGSWVLLLVTAALCVLDAIEIELGAELVIRRRRLGLLVQNQTVPWGSLRHLELVEDASGFGYLLIVAERAWSVPLDAETRQKMASALSQPNPQAT